MITIFAVLFFQRRKWTIQKSRLRGRFYIRKRKIFLMEQKWCYMID